MIYYRLIDLFKFNNYIKYDITGAGLFYLGEDLIVHYFIREMFHEVLHLTEQFKAGVPVVARKQFDDTGDNLGLILSSLQIFPNFKDWS